MSATTINAFPPVHSYDSPRSWFLALIAFLHLGFFWALSAGLIVNVTPDKPRQSELVPIDRYVDPEPKPTPPIEPDRKRIDIYVPPRPNDVEYAPEEDTTSAPNRTTTVTPETTGQAGSGEPLLEEPKIDSRYLTEPVYPPAEIRGLHEGTVVLSVQVLGNGRVGEVRIHQSSGRDRLDQSASREARHWRFKPGMRDGVPVTMWKTIPVTFTLQDRNR